MAESRWSGETPVPVVVRPPSTSAPETSCLAPSVQMYLAPDGDVRACCRNWSAIGNVRDSSLIDIWQGQLRRRLVEHLQRDDFSQGCGQCSAEVAVEGRAVAYPSLYDSFADRVNATGTGSLEWPARIEFNLSNACNLMCIQCDGMLSSAIRAHRDHKPPLPKVYGEQFFRDLESFVPHLTEAQFAGGEPFLAPENFLVWDMVERLNPDLPCLIVTNATQWNDRVERLARTLRMGFVFSIDALTPKTYESIRIRADHASVVANLKRLTAIARGNGMPVEINFCLMRQNYHELGDLLVWAESLGVRVNVSVVRTPQMCSIPAMDGDGLRAVADTLNEIDARVRPQLDQNLRTWLAELERVTRWAESPEDRREQVWWESLEVQPAPPSRNGRADHDRPRSRLGLALVTPVAASPEVEAEALAEWSGTGVHRLDVSGAQFRDAQLDDAQLDGGQDGGEQPETITGCSDSVLGLFQVERSEVLGRPPDHLLGMAQESFGQLEDIRVVDESDDRTEVMLTLREAELRSVVIPRTDDRHRTVGATVVFAVRPRSR